MRPRGWYVVFVAVATIAICHGHQEARSLLNGGRAYVRFTTRQQAEEFAAWWSYDHQPWFNHTKE